MNLIKSLRYSLYIIFRPLDGFWDMKHEKRGSPEAAFIILFLTTIADAASARLTGFIFNNRDPDSINILYEAAGMLLPVILWCIANWCLTTLMDGDGSFKDIFMAACYALTPKFLLDVLLILASNVLTREEGSLYFFLLSLSSLWTLLLIVLGTMVIHQFTLSKTILTVACIIIGMGLLIFIALLFFSLIQEMYGFVYTIYKEIILR